MYKNLVFEGGGMRGAAYALIPKVLQEHGILKDIRKVAGSSAGSIVATMIALKYNPEDIENIFDSLRFDEFSDTPTYTEIVLNFLTSYGINSGEYFTDWIQHIIRMKTASRYTTFEDLFAKTKIELVITGTNYSTGMTEYFSYKTTPKMPVWQAVRISIAIPVFFQPQEYNGNLYIDGGVLSNYPIWIFDNPDSYHQSAVSKDDKKTKKHRQMETLGFKLIPENIGKAEASNNPYFIPVLSLVVRMIFLLVNHAYINCDNYQADTRTVCISTMNVGSTAFSVSEHVKEQLKKNGASSLELFLIKKNANKKSIRTCSGKLSNAPRMFMTPNANLREIDMGRRKSTTGELVSNPRTLFSSDGVTPLIPCKLRKMSHDDVPLTTVKKSDTF